MDDPGEGLAAAHVRKLVVRTDIICPVFQLYTSTKKLVRSAPISTQSSRTT